MLVHLRFMSGETYEHHFKPTDTVLDVKAWATEAFGLGMPEIEILMDAEILTNNTVLEQVSTEARVVFGVVVKGEKLCAWCYEPARHKCSGCVSIRYCTRACQECHWRDHKKHCKGDVSGNEAAGSD